MTYSSDEGPRKAALMALAALSETDYRKESWLSSRIEQALKDLGKEVAREVVYAPPELRATLETKARDAVASLLLDDARLSEAVIAAVSEAISRARLEEEE